MGMFFIRQGVYALFAVTTRHAALSQARRHLEQYLALTPGVSAQAGAQPVRVPALRGVDPDMRDWSLWQVFAHNAIVNRSMSAITQQLARGEALHGAALIDTKHGVMPGPSAGLESVEEFRRSVEEHLAAVSALGSLRGTPKAPHPIFGMFDAHHWNCMFSFHLGLHLPQARFIRNRI